MDIAGTLQAGAAAHQAGNLAQAEKLYRDVLDAAPQDFNALHLLGVVYLQQNRAGEAIGFLQRAVAQNPNFPAVQFNLGLALMEDNRPAEAVVIFNAVITADPNAADARVARDKALAQLARAAEPQATSATALAHLGESLLAQNQFRDARNLFLQALESDPVLLPALRGLVICLEHLGLRDDALPAIDRALDVAPDNEDLHYARALILLERDRYVEAAPSLEAALALAPDRTDVLANTLRARAYTCDWVDDDDAARLRAKISAGDAIHPATANDLISDPAVLRSNACNFIARTYPAFPEPLWSGKTYTHDRLRIAYLSGDLRDHVVGHACVELIERHDRSAFEVIGLSYFGSDEGDFMRTRLMKAFDVFHDAAAWSEADVAQWLADHEVDIAVDLSGYQPCGRPGVLAYRGAPVQISYLGFQPTHGAPFVDYVLADEIAMPPESRIHYVEKIATVPDCYMLTNIRGRLTPTPPTRRSAGLPERSFVFCCFNHCRKFTPEIFDTWMRILKRVEGSVLWLRCDEPEAQRNLRARGLSQGVDRGRIIFAANVPGDAHEARHAVADLFLDTPDYNAHTTATVALWNGLPILTCSGRSFVGRVGASILQAAGLPELIAPSLKDYEDLAVSLAADGTRLAEMRAHLKRARTESALFDLDRTTRNIEAAYRTMTAIQRAGEPPRSFAVPRP